MSFILNPYRFAPPPSSNDFVMEVNTSNAGSASDTIQISVYNGAQYTCNVDWGDGSDTDYNSSSLSTLDHTYTTGGGTYDIRITGTAFAGFNFNNGGDRLKIIDIKSWGDLPFISCSASFFGCENMDISATDAPDLSGVTNCFRMFMFTGALTGGTGISLWDTSTITNMSQMFRRATNFNHSGVSSWSVGNVTDFSYMFFDAANFNQDLGSWNIGSATNFNAFTNRTFSTANYNSILTGWEGQAHNNSVTLGMGSSTYGPCPSAACTARDTLTITDSWTITDGGEA